MPTPPSKTVSRKGIPENDSHTLDGMKPLGQSSAYIIKQKDLLLVFIFNCTVLLYQIILTMYSAWDYHGKNKILWSLIEISKSNTLIKYSDSIVLNLTF